MSLVLMGFFCVGPGTCLGSAVVIGLRSLGVYALFAFPGVDVFVACGLPANGGGVVGDSACCGPVGIVIVGCGPVANEGGGVGVMALCGVVGIGIAGKMGDIGITSGIDVAANAACGSSPGAGVVNGALETCECDQAGPPV